MGRKVIGAVLVAALGLGLAACASGPSQDEVVERYLIEYAGTTDLRIQEVRATGVLMARAEDAAQAAADGKCGDDAYYSTLQKDAEYAFGMTCTMYYADDMSEDQVNRFKLETLEQIKDDLE